MSHTAQITSALLSTISAAVTPVVLISAAAILMGAFTAKYTAIASQMRTMTAEMRNPATTPERKSSVKRQLHIFNRRINAVWRANTLLGSSVIAFVVTVLAVFFAANHLILGSVAIGGLVIGILLVLCAVVLEVYEVSLARKTMDYELEEAFANQE